MTRSEQRSLYEQEATAWEDAAGKLRFSLSWSFFHRGICSSLPWENEVLRQRMKRRLLKIAPKRIKVLTPKVREDHFWWPTTKKGTYHRIAICKRFAKECRRLAGA